jgi:hypothetical protein
MVQEDISRQTVRLLDAWRDAVERISEQSFLAIYGSPMLQAAVGIDPSSERAFRQAPRDPLHLQLVQQRVAEIKARIPGGGIREAIIRSVLFVGMARESVDERGFETVRKVRHAGQDLPAVPIMDFKKLVREQYFMLLIDQDAAVAAIPAMLPADLETRAKALDLISVLLQSRGVLPPEGQARLLRITRMFGAEPEAIEVTDESEELPATAGPFRSRVSATQSKGSSV